MSDNGAEEASKPYSPEMQISAGVADMIVDDLRARISELERREALLTAFVEAHDAVDGWIDSRKQRVVGLDEWHVGFDERINQVEASRTALTDAGFPWTDGDR